MTPTQRLALLKAGKEPKLILKMKSGFAVMGDTQFLPGYALLLAYPKVGQLNDLTGEARSHFLEDMASLGDAVREATECKRVNYSVYGNLDPFLHAHIWPRYEWEDPTFATMPPFHYPEELRNDHLNAYTEATHKPIQEAIRDILSRGS